MADLVSSPSLSAEHANDLMTWAVGFARDYARMLLKAANQDGFLALSVKPGNELEELEWLQQRRAANEMVLAAPMDLAHMAERQQAQLEMQRMYLLQMKFQDQPTYTKRTAGG